MPLRAKHPELMLSLIKPEDEAERMSNLSRAYRVNLAILALVALLTGVFIVQSNMQLMTARQLGSLAILQVLGTDAKSIQAFMRFQALLIGAIVLGDRINHRLGLRLVFALTHRRRSRCRRTQDKLKGFKSTSVAAGFSRKLGHSRSLVWLLACRKKSWPSNGGGSTQRRAATAMVYQQATCSRGNGTYLLGRMLPLA